jgi:phosphatidylserine/phosphatidylglycerophosphate/cardiolipin synthase-like enzyme
VVLVCLLACATSFEKRTVYHYKPSYGVASPEFEHLLATQGGGLSGGNQATLLSNGDAFFPAMLEAIRASKASVNIELYIFAKGEMAERFIERRDSRAPGRSLSVDAFTVAPSRRRSC